MNVNVPSLAEQKRITTKFSLIFNEIEKINTINTEQIKNYITLKSAIIKKELINKAA